MRQLKIAKTLTPAQEAEAAAALQWLEQQPVPAGYAAAEVAARFRYILAVARQYRGRGLGLVELVLGGYRAGVVSLNEKAMGLWCWWVREGMIEATEKKKP